MFGVKVELRTFNIIFHCVIKSKQHFLSKLLRRDVITPLQPSLHQPQKQRAVLKKERKGRKERKEGKEKRKGRKVEELL